MSIAQPRLFKYEAKSPRTLEIAADWKLDTFELESFLNLDSSLYGEIWRRTNAGDSDEVIQKSRGASTGGYMRSSTGSSGKAVVLVCSRNLFTTSRSLFPTFMSDLPEIGSYGYLK